MLASAVFWMSDGQTNEETVVIDTVLFIGSVFVSAEKFRALYRFDCSSPGSMCVRAEKLLPLQTSSAPGRAPVRSW